MPTLIQNHKKTVLHNQFKQAYSILSQVHMQMINDDILPYEQFVTNHTITDEIANAHINTMSKYLNATVCDSHYKKCTGGQGYKILDGTSGAHIDADAYTKKTILLNNGITIWRGGLTFGRDRYYVDINGTAKGPNKLGYDLFTFRIDSNNKLTPEKDSGSLNRCSFVKAAHSKNYLGFGCAYYALIDQSPDEEGKNYWKDFLK